MKDRLVRFDWAMKKAISINIVYFDLGHGEDYIYKGTTDFKGLHKNDLLHPHVSGKMVSQTIRLKDILV
ncbi:MAG: hypothetical protein HQK63_15920 [Desulfamplus sp.]|nr:hypothetical protein [Desulfamplus sp.]